VLFEVAINCSSYTELHREQLIATSNNTAI
jgi:hypothetical protein